MSYTCIPITYSKNIGTTGRFSASVTRHGGQAVRPDKFVLDTGHPLAQNLLFAGLGRNDDDGQFEDSVNKNNAVVAGTPTWSQELGRNVLTLNGTTDYVRVNKVLVPYVTTEILGVTFAGWYYTSDNTNDQNLFGFLRSTSYERGLSCLLGGNRGSDPYVARLYTGSANEDTGGAINVNTWTHVAFRAWTENGYIQWQVFEDGTLVIDDPAGIQGDGSWGVADWTMFGAASSNIGLIRFFTGKMADLMVWGRCLSAQEISGLADSDNVMLNELLVEHAPRRRLPRSTRTRRAATSRRPSSFELDYQHPLADSLMFAGLGSGAGGNIFNDSSRYRKNGTLTGMDPATDWVSALGRWALDFGGTDDYVSHGSIALSNRYTFSAWIKDPSAASAATWGGASNNYMLNCGGTAYHVANNGGGASAIFSWAAQTYTGWNHWSVVRDAGDCTLFKNGISQGTDTDAETGTTIAVTDIAKYLTNYCTMTGADFLLHDRPLSVAEVKQLADPDNVMLSGLIRESRKTSRIIVPEIGYQTNNNVQRPDEFTLDYSHPLAKGLVFAGLGAHAGSKHYHDSSAHGISGTGVGGIDGTYWERALGRYAIALPSTDTIYVDGGTHAIHGTGFTDITVAYWAKHDVNSTYQQPFTKGKYSGANAGWHCTAYMHATPSSREAYFYLNGTPRITVALGAALDAEWHHWTWRRSGSTVTMLFDGVPTGTPGSYATALAGANPLYIGRGNTNTLFQMQGLIADTLVYNRAISDSEGKQLADPSNPLLSGMIRSPQRVKYFPGVDLDPVKPKVYATPQKLTTRPANFEVDHSHPLAKNLLIAGLGANTGGNTWRDSSAYRRAATVENFTWSQAHGRRTFSAVADTDTIELPPTIVLDPRDITFACWAMLSDISWNYTFLCYLKGTHGSGGHQIYFDATENGTAGSWYFVTQWGTVTSDAVIEVDRWYQLVGRVKGGTANMFVNGVQQADSGTVTDTSHTYDDYITIGAWTNARSIHDGAMADFMLWDRALSVLEIQQLADPANVMLSGMIKPVGDIGSIGPTRNSKKRYWVGRDADWNKSHNWAYSPGIEGGAGIPNENDDVILE